MSAPVPARYFVLGDDGEPVAVPDVLTWALWLEDAHVTGASRIGDTMVGEVRVSTIFIGLRPVFDGPNLKLFETMVCRKLDMMFWRYSLGIEARRGHDAIVRALQDGAQPSPNYLRATHVRPS
jgi:hypothetical protein